jgi:hypothetical protein
MIGVGVLGQTDFTKIDVSSPQPVYDCPTAVQVEPYSR